MPNLTLQQFAHLFSRAAATAPRREQQALAGSGARLARHARSYIGTYQGPVGPFPAWRQLSVNTLMGGVSPTGYRYPGKIALGYAPPDNPLLRTGEMRASIAFMVQGRSAVVGSDDPVALWQEMGTTSSPRHVAIPPRPFLGRAVYAHGWEETQHVARVVFRPLLTGRL